MRKFLTLFSIFVFCFAQNVWGASTVRGASTQRADSEIQSSGALSGSSIPAVSAPSTAPTPGADPACTNAQNRANLICLKNSGLNSAIDTVSKIVAAGTAGLSLLDACSKFNDALKIANDALIVYNGACSAAGYFCQNSCTSAAAATGVLPTVATADKTAAEACQAMMHKSLKDAAMGIGGIAASSLLGSKCKKDMTDTASTTCTASTSNPLCINGVDCSNSANAQNSNCICNASPNSPGCPGATSYGSTYGSANFGATTDTTGSATAATTTATGSSGSSLPAARSALGAADSGTSGSAGGGGGSVSGEGMAASGGTKSATADKKAALNPNILSGYDGEGGGGSRSGSSGSGASAYNAYMPGAAKDPARALASQNVGGSSQVTTSASKSNWEKINERYQDNTSSLIGD